MGDQPAGIGIHSKVQIDGRARSVLDITFDGKNTLTTQGTIFAIGADVDVAGGRVQIDNINGSAEILPRSWFVRNGVITPIPPKEHAPADGAPADGAPEEGTAKDSKESEK